MRRGAKGDTTDDAGSQGPPPEDDLVGLPPGLAFAGDDEEESERLEDLESQGPGAEGDQEEPEPPTPGDAKLRKELADAQAMIGRMGDELGQLRQGRSEARPPAGQGIVPVQGGPDPFQQAFQQATDDFVRTGDTTTFAMRMNTITDAKLRMGLQYAETRLNERDAENKAEVDFFAKNTDLLDGAPRSIYEGELAKVKLHSPRTPAPELRRQAAEATRTMLQDLNYRLVDEDEAARREGARLRGPAGRRSRTGSPGTSGASAVAATTTEYVRAAQEAQRRSQSRV